MSNEQNGSRQRSPRPRPSPPSENENALLRQLHALVDGLRNEVQALREELTSTTRAEIAGPEASLSPDEVADRLGISRRTLDDLEAKGEIEAVQVGGQVRYETSEVRDFIRRNRRGDGGP